MRGTFLFVFLFGLYSQVLPVSKRKLVASVPFEVVGTYVIVKININGSTPLNMILDTGVRNTIITELYPEDNVLVDYNESRNVQGLGQTNVLDAFVSNNNELRIGRVILRNKTVFVLKEDIFNLSIQTGSKINGLLGADIFRDYIVQIDYTNLRLRFYDPEHFEAPSKYGFMPMTIEKSKMYIHLSVLEKDTARRSIKMLMDTGAELTAWFQTLTNKAVSIPEKSIKGKIGEGLSGEITGYYARVPQICISNFCVKNPIVAFPDSAMIAQIMQRSDRDGTIGSKLLSRFNLIIDTRNRRFYFKPNSNFNKEFLYNIAGIEIIQPLVFIPHFEVINVWKDSPADVSGLKKGDIITEVNGEKLLGFSIIQVRSFFEKPSSRYMTLKVQRNADTLELKVDMKAKI